MFFEDFLEKVSGKKSDIITYTGAEALKAVEQDGYALRYVNEQTEDICLKAVERNGYALQYVNEQTEDICLKAVEQDGDALRYVNELIFSVKAKLKVSIADIEAKFGCEVDIVCDGNKDE